MWEEIAQYEPFPDKYAVDDISHKKFVEKTRVFELLAGLNPDFEHIRIQLLSRETYPNLSIVYSHLYKEERQRQVMLAPSIVKRSSLLSSSH